MAGLREGEEGGGGGGGGGGGVVTLRVTNRKCGNSTRKPFAQSVGKQFGELSLHFYCGRSSLGFPEDSNLEGGEERVGIWERE